MTAKKQLHHTNSENTHMKKTYIAAVSAALMGFGSVAISDDPVLEPVMLTDTQMDNIVAGDSALWGGCAAYPCAEIIVLNPDIFDLYGGPDNNGVESTDDMLSVGAPVPGPPRGADFRSVES